MNPIPMKRKNLAVPAETYLKIERVAVEVTAKTGKITKWTDIVNYMITNYLDEARQDLIHQRNQTKKNVHK